MISTLSMAGRGRRQSRSVSTSTPSSARRSSTSACHMTSPSCKNSGSAILANPPPVTYSKTNTFMPASLALIPVLDLMDGQVVRAFGGRRDEYRPLESALCDSSRPEAVVEGLLALYPFRRIYIADLDAILGRGNHGSVVERLQRLHPDLEFWVDGGFSGTAAAQAWQAAGRGRPVLGSESLAVLPERDAWPAQGVLSLDFRGDDFLGSATKQQNPKHKPTKENTKTQTRVGMVVGFVLVWLLLLLCLF